MKKFIIGGLCYAASYAQSCEVEEAYRLDCGFMGIDQRGCQAKQCCWKPGSGPWCFFPAGQNPCENMDFKGTQGAGFDDSFGDKMWEFFDKNINIQGKGGIVASPDPNTPGGSYYYHWMRDAGLTMRTYMELLNFDLSKMSEKMKAYVQWVRKVQSETDPNGNDVRINPKFELPNGQVYVGGWCRPQTDGPALRSAALIKFAQVLIDKGEQSYAKSSVLPLIKYDLDWIHSNWSSGGCDLWEQVRSEDFFWNRMSFHYAMGIANKLYTKIGDSDYAAKCASTRSAVGQTLDKHWTGSFMTESSNRQKDTATIHAFSSFDAYQITDAKVASTIKVLALTFCAEYAINQEDNKANIPGMLFGRYPGDSYAGGNPWQLLTAVVAKAFYQGATVAFESNGFKTLEDKKAWADLLKLPEDATVEDFVKGSLSAGDSVMYRLYQHVKNDGGHIAEQIGRNSGSQTSAKDLTWSFANILSAMQYRKSAVSAVEKMSTVEIKTE